MSHDHDHDNDQADDNDLDHDHDQAGRHDDHDRARQARDAPGAPRSDSSESHVHRLTGVCVVGPMGAGNRVLRDVIQASGIPCWVDTSHGTSTEPVNGPGVVVVVITRDETAVKASWRAGWVGHDAAVNPDDSIAMIRCRYRGAVHVTYEDLCSMPDAVIQQIADTIGVPPWPCPIKLESQNNKWFTGEGGPQIGAGTPFN